MTAAPAAENPVREISEDRYPRGDRGAHDFPEARKTYRLEIVRADDRDQENERTDRCQLYARGTGRAAGGGQLPPRQIGPAMSEVLTLGFGWMRKARSSCADTPVPNGSRLFWPSSH